MVTNNKMMKGGYMNHVIVAPHPDDEIIGCYEVLQREENIIIIYSPDVDMNRRKEAVTLKDRIEGIKVQMFQNSIPMSMHNDKFRFYFPDPVYEIHPKHRQLGMSGEQYARMGLDVIFYTTSMNAPYIHETVSPNMKEDLLNKVYPSQSDMWRFEKKYVLFEGYCKWIF